MQEERHRTGSSSTRSMRLTISLGSDESLVEVGEAPKTDRECGEENAEGDDSCEVKDVKIKYEGHMIPSLTERGQCGTGAHVLRAGRRVEKAFKLVD